MFEVDMPLPIGLAFGVAPIGNPVRAPFEGVELDRDMLAAEDGIHRVAVEVAQIAGTEFGGDAVAAPAIQVAQRQDQTDQLLGDPVLDAVRAGRAWTQRRESLARGQALPGADGADRERKVALSAGLILRQGALGRLAFGELLAIGLIGAHNFDPKLEVLLAALAFSGTVALAFALVAIGLAAGGVGLSFRDLGLALLGLVCDTHGRVAPVSWCAKRMT